MKSILRRLIKRRRLRLMTKKNQMKNLKLKSPRAKNFKRKSKKGSLLMK